MLLLSVVFSASLAPSAFGDEQLRKLQEELRKRHLFFGNINGESSPALTTAIARYQRKKGFVVTGIVDRATRESLGIPGGAPQIDPTPFVLSWSGEVHGMNGELLPNSTPPFAPTSSDPTWTDGQPLEVADIAVPPSEGAEERIQSPGGGKRHAHRTPHRRTPPPKETNPLTLAYNSMNHALRWVLGDTQSQKKKRNPARRG